MAQGFALSKLLPMVSRLWGVDVAMLLKRQRSSSDNSIIAAAEPSYAVEGPSSLGKSRQVRDTAPLPIAEIQAGRIRAVWDLYSRDGHRTLVGCPHFAFFIVIMPLLGLIETPAGSRTR